MTFFTLRLRDQRSEYVNARWMVKSKWIRSYMASNGSCFMVNRTIFKTPPLGGRPNTKNRETMALLMLTTVGLFHFIMREDSCE